MNSDPYKILGVSPDATDAEIKTAYKALVKKYHPDQYQDNPLASVAAEKMTDINAAYDEIMAQRRNGSSGGYTYNAGNGDYSAYGFDSAQVRSLIQNGNVTEADRILDQVGSGDRSGEWYFLKGSVCYKRGWLNEAYQNFQRAVQLNPSNAEYTAAFNQMNMQRGGYMNGNPNPMGANNGVAGMDCCSQLCCADCCCEMMGGDLIPCC